MSIIPISSAIIPNCCIGYFGSACQLDGNSMFFELKQPIKEAEASDADKANVAKEAYEANKADEAEADEVDTKAN
jgi:hypothetical protein